MNDEAALRHLVARIEATFGRDLDGWLACFDHPLVVVAPDATMAFPDRDGARARFGPVFEALVARGFHSTAADEVRVRVAGADLAFIDASFTRRRADDSELERVAAVYVCRRADDAWRVAALVPRPADAPVLLDPPLA